MKEGIGDSQPSPIYSGPRVPLAEQGSHRPCWRMSPEQPDTPVWKKAVDTSPQALILWGFILPPLSFLELSNAEVEEHALSEVKFCLHVHPEGT